MKKRTAWGMCAAWMAVIFWISALDATNSGGLSCSLSENLAFLQNRVLHLGWT